MNGPDTKCRKYEVGFIGLKYRLKDKKSDEFPPGSTPGKKILFIPANQGVN
jgi:hypothetical protein